MAVEVLVLQPSSRARAGRPTASSSPCGQLSAANLLDKELPRTIAGTLAEFRLPPRLLQLEITEDTLMVDPVGAVDIIERVRALGVRFALDDFGTGYSSLAYLKRLAVDELKIDRSFVMHMLEDEGDAIIVRSTIDLARNFGLRTVAEGVEDEATWQRLTEFGCDVAQGYILSRPVPADEFAAWVRDRTAARFVADLTHQDAAHRADLVSRPREIAEAGLDVGLTAPGATRT